MPRSAHARLDDILAAAERIAEFSADMTLEEFRDDLRTVHAVLHNIVLIGEAAKGVSDTVRSTTPEIPWLEMAGMRDVVVHDYFKDDIPIVWNTARQSVPDAAGKISKARSEGRFS